MTTKNKIVAISWFGILLACIIVSILSPAYEPLVNYVKIFIFIWLGYSLLLIIISLFEIQQIKACTNKYSDNYDELIKFYKKVVKKYFIFVASRNCQIQLAATYLLNDNIDEARKEFTKFNIKVGEKHAYYPRFLLAIADNDQENIDYYYGLICNNNDSKFNIQIENAEAIMHMINTNEYDDNLYNSTSYPLVKRLCLKYKNNEKTIDIAD